MCDAKPNTVKDISADEPNGMADTNKVRAQCAAVKKECLVDSSYIYYSLRDLEMS
jgi:hypothetical protein